MFSLVDGQFKQFVTTDNRNVQFGDGIFETCLLEDVRLFFWDYHFKRLEIGAERLGIILPKSSVWLADIQKLINRSRYKNALVKLILSRGSSHQGYTGYQLKAVRIVSIIPLAKAVKTTIKLGVCSHYYSHNPQLAGIKHCNRLDNILARQSLDKQYNDGIMLDQNGKVISTTKANIFMVKEDKIMTPQLSYCGIAGSRRAVIFELCPRLNLFISEQDISLDELQSADEVFISNSLLGIVGVSHILGTKYPHREHTLQLQQLFNEFSLESAHLITPHWTVSTTPKLSLTSIKGISTTSLLALVLILSLLLFG